MDYNFTGTTAPRIINLGGPSGLSAAQVAAAARAERAARLQARQRVQAATDIQAFWRGRTAASAAGDELWSRFTPGQVDLVQSTRAVIWSARGDKQAQRLHAWTHTVLADQQAFFEPFANTNTAASWHVLTRLMVSRLIQRLLASPPVGTAVDAQRAESEGAVQVLALLCNPNGPAGHLPAAPQGSSNETLAQSMGAQMLSQGLHAAIRAYMLSFPPVRKASASVGPALDLALLPFQLFPAAAMTPSNLTQARQLATSTLVREILTLPHLPSRLPLPTLAKLAADLPLLDVTSSIRELGESAAAAQGAGEKRRETSAPSSTSSTLSTPHLLANFIALASRRVPHLTTSPALIAYLEAISLMQDGLPRSVFEGALDAAHAGASPSHMDEDEAYSAASKVSTDPATHKRLSVLVAASHLDALLAASGKLPNSRPSLAKFICSTLAAWPSNARERVFAAVMFGANTGGMLGSFTRELWRGWVRSSQLARALSGAGTAGAGGSRAALATLADPKLQPDWAPLVALCELYSRLLLTLGDDEFFPASLSTASLGVGAAPSKNPLSLDDVLSLSSLARTLAFALYWLEGAGPGTSLDIPVPGLRISRGDLRSLLTTLLKQIHARDSRRKFAPQDHWLMTSALDLQSFLETAVLEEDELAGPAAAEEPTAGEAMDMDQNEEDLWDAGTSQVSTRVRARRGRGNNLSARQLAFLSPRLGVLNNIPFVIPFELRVEVFRQFIRNDAKRLGIARHGLGTRRNRRVTVRRDHIAHDGFLALNPLGAQLKDTIEIVFLDQWGNEEAGIDGGGLFKEFFTSLAKEVFDTDRGLWQATAQHELYPNPHSYARAADSLAWFEFLGRVLGKALYEGILVDIKFARFFLSKWLGKQSFLDDLEQVQSLDPELYRGLIQLKNYTGDVEQDLALNFAATDESFGETITTELVPGGSNIPVTRENRLRYIYLISHYRLSVQIAKQCDAFFAGLSQMIDARWLRILDVDELRVLVSGTEEPIDVENLRKHTVLGGYHEKDEVVEFFWQALHSFSQEERKAFLKFVTSCPSPPLLGFSQLQPNFAIRHSGDDETRLPSAATCVNMLRLPRYTSFEQLRQKLLYAVTSGSGFDLS